MRYAYANSYPNSDTDPYAHPDRDTDRDPDRYTHTDSWLWRGLLDANADTYRNSYSHPDADTHVYSLYASERLHDTDSGSYANPDAYADSGSDRNTNGFANGNPAGDGTSEDPTYWDSSGRYSARNQYAGING